MVRTVSTKSTLDTGTRADLDKKARKLKLDPTQYKNKRMLADAIEAATLGDGKDTKTKLNPKQELFCQYYISQDFFGNGTQAYAEAYNVDLSEKGGYNTARSNAHKLLTNTDILTRIDQILELAGLNDQFVDRQLTFWMTQKAEGPTAMKAISEYNKLKKRINPLDGDEGAVIAVVRYLPERMPDSVYAEYMKDEPEVVKPSQQKGGK